MSGPRGRGDLVSIVVMGVAGSGKSTIAKELAARHGYDMLDADELHSAAEILKMATGHPLSDDDRLPWLQRVGERIHDEIDAGRSSVTACSALRRTYRDVLRHDAPGLFFVWLDGPIDVVRERMLARHDHFMPATLLESQYATLEPLAPDELGVRIDLTNEPTALIDEVERALQRA